jgi:hypothetical protein
MAILNNSNAISSGGYDINNSLRFRASASAYLSRTPASSGSTTLGTFSNWLKLGAISIDRMMYHVAGTSGNNNRFYISFNADDTVGVVGYNSSGSAVLNLNTTQVFRDPSAWYHIVVAVDTTQATAANRIKLYINGSQVTAFSTATYPAQNQALGFTNNTSTLIGSNQGVGNLFDGYMTEVNFINGQALTPSSFGETDTTTGSWKPKAYTGTYGTNGFYLKFSDIATTSGSNAGLGKDFSGNGNYYNTNNISVTAGTTYDAMTDVPTNTSPTVANYATLNPLYIGLATLTNGNLYAQSTTTAYRSSIGTIQFPTSGKYYFEVTIVSNNGSGNNQSAGIVSTTNDTYYFYIDCFATSSTSIRKVVDGTPSGAYGTASNGTIIGVAVDASNGKAYLAINNTWIDSSSPTGGTGGYSMASGQEYAPIFQGYNSGQSAFNFGQQPFTYTPPSGYNRLNTFNLPNSAIVQGNKVMDATLYTGTGATQSITNAGSFKPDLVWTKSRSSGALFNNLNDSVRGATRTIFSNSTQAEDTTTPIFSAFNTNGFAVGSDVSANQSGQTFVGWQWQAGKGTTSSNTSGTITSTVSVNASAGFSVVTYTGNGATGATVGHGLGVAPKMVIVKQRSGAEAWVVGHQNLTGWNYILNLNSTAAQFIPSTQCLGTPTSTNIVVGPNSATNANTGTYVAYCWAEIAGYSKFGSYTGNGSTDGPFVYLGFRPEFVLIKNTTSAFGWHILDTARNTYNLATNQLFPNTTSAEGTGAWFHADLLSNGFKLRLSASESNANGSNYIYMAFAENPFKNSLAR